MGAGKDKTEIKTIIKNEIDIEVTTETKNLNNIVNESTTNISTNMVQSAAASIIQTTTGSNTISMGALVARRGGKIDVSQQAKAESENKAIIQIVMSADSMAKLGNDIINDITNKVKNDQAAKQSMESLAKIGELTKQAGGPEAMVDKIADMAAGMMKNVTGGSTETSSTTEITNSIKTKLKNTTINSSDIKNAITTNITNSMKMAAEAKCDMNTSADNVLNISSILADEAGSEAIVKQDVNVKSFNNCFIKLEMGTKIANELTNGFKVGTESETTTKQSTDQALKSDATITKETVQESAIMESVDKAVHEVAGVANNAINLAGMGIYLIIGGGIFLVAFIFYMMSGSSNKDSDSNNDNDNDNDNKNENNENEPLLRGGDILSGLINSNTDGNIYLLAFFVTIIIVISRKTLPLCGVLLIVIFLYFEYKKNRGLLNYLRKIL